MFKKIEAAARRLERDATLQAKLLMALGSVSIAGALVGYFLYVVPAIQY